MEPKPLEITVKIEDSELLEQVNAKLFELENRLKTNEDKLLKILNDSPQFLEPIYLESFNSKIKISNNDGLDNFEKENPEFGLALIDNEIWGTSTLALMATITGVLIGKRLAFITDWDDPRGRVVGFQWYKE